MLKACICAFLDRRNNQCPSGYCNFKRLQKPNIRTFSEYTKLVGVMSNCTMYNRNPLPSPLTFAYSPLSFARLLFTTLFPTHLSLPPPLPSPSPHPASRSSPILTPPLVTAIPLASSAILLSPLFLPLLSHPPLPPVLSILLLLLLLPHVPPPLPHHLSFHQSFLLTLLLETNAIELQQPFAVVSGQPALRWSSVSQQFVGHPFALFI